jgi:hypothetical protein
LSSDRRDIDKLTHRSVQFKIDTNTVKYELTHRSVHLSSDRKDIDELIHRSVHKLQIIGVRMNLQKD